MDKYKINKTIMGVHRTEELKKGEEIRIDRDAYVANGAESLQERHRDATAKIKRGLHIKELQQKVRNDAYSTKVKNILTPEERKKEIKKKGSILYLKANNRKLCAEAKAEYNKKYEAAISKFKKTELYSQYISTNILADDEIEVDYLSDERASFEQIFHCCSINKAEFDKSIFEKYISGDDKRYEALDVMVENFINMKFDFDFTNDDSFSRETLQLEHVRATAEAIITILRDNPSYWADLSDEIKAVIMEKNNQATALVNYGDARSRLITDKYYSTHLNSELSVEDPMAKSGLVSIRIIESEAAYNELMEIDSNMTQTEINHSANTKTEMDMEYVHKRSVLGNVKGLKHVTQKSNSNFLDIFGSPLKCISNFMRNARRKFGKEDYEEGKTLYKRFPEELKNIGADDYKLKKHETLDSAPEIELGKYFADPLKIELNNKIKSERVTELLGDEETMYSSSVKTARENFKVFIQAASMYSDIRGIVNADTTLIEMSTLDKMADCIKNLEVLYHESNSAAIKGMLDFSKECNDPLIMRGKGKLSEKINENDLQFYANNLSAIVMDTDIENNMEESNIQDIPLFTHLPNINDIKQSTIGDCYLVAAMTTLVAADPEAVLSMFHDYGDGNVLVRLYKPFNENDEVLDTEEKIKTTKTLYYKPVYYKLRKHYETGDGIASDCTWPQLIEKAYAAGGFNMKGAASVDENGLLHEVEKELTCGAAERALSYLCGRHITGESNFKTSKNERVISYAQKELNVFNKNVKEDSSLWLRLGAGIPSYIYDEMHDGIKKEEYYCQDAEYFRNRMLISCETLALEIGTALMQVKKNCIKNKIDYRAAITTFARVTGIKLADNWDTQTNCRYINASDINTIHESIYNIDEVNQPWHSLIDGDYLKQKCINKFNENIEAVLTNKPVVYDEQGLDIWCAFERDIIEKTVTEVERLSREEPKNFAENAVENIIKAFDVAEAIKINNGAEVATTEGFHRGLDKIWNENANADEMANTTFQVVHNNEFDLKNVDKKKMFLRNIMEAIDRSGSVEISINHFIAAIDYKKMGDDWFILIKDPFNVYNHTYLRNDDNTISNSEDGFFSVLSLSGNEIKRHLDKNGDAERSIYGGFRGLSWWNLNDLYNETKYLARIHAVDINK